jgi:NADPH:quinone reductase-like Zn-dependent oxidoreductase
VRAVVHDRYGPPGILRVAEVERPVPADDEVLVRVRATTVTRTDCHVRRASPFVWRLFAGLLRPRKKILGIEYAGVVETVGAAVDRLAVGDEVFGGTAGRFGAHAEYVCVPGTAPLVPKPAGSTFEEAAAVCDGFMQGLTCVRAGGVGKGTRILVYGASGSCGTAVVQLARHYDAHVTAVCGTKNVELVRSLGADEVIDYQREDFRRNGEAYDVVVDAVGLTSLLRCRRSVRPGGIFVATDLGRLMLENPLSALLTRWVGERRVRFPLGRWTRDDLLFLKELMEAGRYRAVVDRAYPLEDVVEATAYVETGQKTGNVVLVVG